MPSESSSISLKTALRPLVLWASVLYLIVLCGVLYSLDHCTERQWYFGALLYLPTEGWLLPLVLLMPLALLTRPSVLLLHVAAVAAVYFGYDKGSSTMVAQASTDAPTLTVVTANIGQRSTKALDQFIDDQDPDVIAFQEVRYGGKKMDAKHPEYYHQAQGEFTLASKFPVRQSGIVPDLTFQDRPVAAWFELEYQGHTIVIYSVHMPTPRAYLAGLRGSGISSSLLSGGGFLSDESRQDYEYYWQARFELAHGLMAVLQKEQRPMIVVGDFNTPDHGGLYKLFASEMTDTFAAAGTGSGETFPANTRGRLAELGPWMRLDYQFSGRGWRPLASEVEPLTPAQHLALLGKYQLVADEKTSVTEPKAVQVAVTR